LRKAKLRQEEIESSSVKGYPCIYTRVRILYRIQWAKKRELDDECCKHCANPENAESHPVNTKFIPLVKELLALFILFLLFRKLFNVDCNRSNPKPGYRSLCKYSNKPTKENIASRGARCERDRSNR